MNRFAILTKLPSSTIPVIENQKRELKPIPRHLIPSPTISYRHLIDTLPNVKFENVSINRAKTSTDDVLYKFDSDIEEDENVHIDSVWCIEKEKDEDFYKELEEDYVSDNDYFDDY